jgi:uncharacterized membrane protein
MAVKKKAVPKKKVSPKAKTKARAAAKPKVKAATKSRIKPAVKSRVKPSPKKRAATAPQRKVPAQKIEPVEPRTFQEPVYAGKPKETEKKSGKSMVFVAGVVVLVIAGVFYLNTDRREQPV